MAESGPYRLAQGGLVDRRRSLAFSFNNRRYVGFAGDSLASALLANGVRTIGRSFKFHRPRGIFSCGIEEPNALLQLGAAERAVPSARATMEELRLRYGVACGRRVLLATNNDSVYPLAEELAEAGVNIVGVLDSRDRIDAVWRQRLRDRSIKLFEQSIPVDTTGFGALRGVSIGRLSADARTIETIQRVRCDALGVSAGWNPVLALVTHAGGKLAYDANRGMLWPTHPPPHVRIVGRAARCAAEAPGPRISPVGNPQRQWVDLLHDVTVADLALALRENFTSVEHVKRYTTVGMAADQGKTSAVAAIEVLARLQSVSPNELAHTTMRPPAVPVTLGAIARRALRSQFSPHRLLPLHGWHTSHAALLQDFSGWQRVVAYVRAEESREAATLREARAVRTRVGLYDSSSLGKIEIHGPDALEFVDRFYLNSLAGLRQGRVRYGLMLRESGTLLDDGTIAILPGGLILLTTTSGNADRVHAWLEEWHQTEWPHLQLAIVPVTEQWATLSLSGPCARAVLGRLETDIDLSPDAFPHLSVREGHVLGKPARLYRVSFSGELTYEINVPSSSALAVWEALLAAGAQDQIEPIGLDALMLLRLEKGFLHIGADTDGTTIPADVGWGNVAAKKMSDFIGKRSLLLPEYRRTDRLQLVGLAGSAADLVVGSHLRLPGTQHGTDGWITSAGRAVLSGEPIAMALLRAGQSRAGAEVSVHHVGDIGRAKVVTLPFFDPSGVRMNA